MDKIDKVRRVSRGGVFLGHWSGREAQARIREGRAKVRSANRKRLFSVIDLEAGVGASVPGGTLQTVQDEHLHDTLSVLVLRRAVGISGHSSYANWDPNLTFRELRAGRIVSEQTVRERREARSLRFIENKALLRREAAAARS